MALLNYSQQLACARLDLLCLADHLSSIPYSGVVFEPTSYKRDSPSHRVGLSIDLAPYLSDLGLNRTSFNSDPRLNGKDSYFLLTSRAVLSAAAEVLGATLATISDSFRSKISAGKVAGLKELPENWAFMDQSAIIVFIESDHLHIQAFTSDAIKSMGGRTGLRTGSIMITNFDDTNAKYPDSPSRKAERPYKQRAIAINVDQLATSTPSMLEESLAKAI